MDKNILIFSELKLNEDNSITEVVIDYDLVHEGKDLRDFIYDEFGPISYDIVSNIDLSSGLGQMMFRYKPEE